MRSSGQKAERAFLKKNQAHRQPRSGGIPGFPNDGRKGKWLIEIKSTVHRSLGIKDVWLRDLEESALTRSLHPVLIVVWDGLKITGLEREWAMIPKSLFDQLGLWER